MNRFMRFMILMTAIAWAAGCGGGHNDDHQSVPTQKLRLVIREWRFPEGHPVQTILQGEFPRLTNGVQFDLLVSLQGSSAPVKLPLSNVEFFRSEPIASTLAELEDDAFVRRRLAQGVKFQRINVFSWEDKTVCRFFRIDEQSLVAIYKATACVQLPDGKVKSAEIFFRVFCVGTP